MSQLNGSVQGKILCFTGPPGRTKLYQLLPSIIFSLKLNLFGLRIFDKMSGEEGIRCIVLACLCHQGKDQSPTGTTVVIYFSNSHYQILF